MNTTLGKKFSELLEKQGLSQRELAEAAGVTDVAISRYIRETRIPRMSILIKIASALHTTPEYLLGREDGEDPELLYYRTQRLVARNACNWTKKQKADLINALINDD